MKVQLDVVIEFNYEDNAVQELEKLRQEEKPNMDLETFVGYVGQGVVKEIMDNEYQCVDGESYIIGTKVKIIKNN